MNALRRALSLVLTACLLGGSIVVAASSAQAATEIYPAPASGAWSVDGRGYGHGRGMSQWGTQGAAQQGRTADEILAFYYPGTSNANIGGAYVTVALSAFTPSSTVTVWSPEGRNIRMGSINHEEVLPPGRWTVSVLGQTVTAQRRDTVGGAVTETRTYVGVLRFESLEEYGMIIAASATATSGRWYRGDLRIQPTTGTGFNVTNTLPMEDYLRGVVPRESPAGWLPAALQSQAVAARAYAWYKVQHQSTLCDTTSCQVYGGKGVADASGSLTTPYEYASTDAAIAATAGRVLTYQGAVALTEFSSSNGGWTRAGGVPYQVAKPDPWTGTATGDTVTTWTTTLSVATVAKQCPSGGQLQQMVVLERDGNGPLGGRIGRVRLDCTTGSTEIVNPTFGMRSTWWKARDVGVVLGDPAQSASVISYGGQMSLAATPSVGVTWTLTVRDPRTGRTVITRTGTALAGVRFNATWFGSSAAGSFVGAGTYALELSAVSAAGVSATPFRSTVEVLPAPDPAPVTAVPLVPDAGYVPVAPVRLVDTRQTFDSIGANQQVDLQIAGRAGVPTTGATAVVLNLTAVAATRDTHLRIWPTGAARPDTSVLNTDARRTQASLVTVGLGGGGKVSLLNAAGSMHYVVDVVGYYTTALATSSRYTAVDPVRAYTTMTGARLTGGSTVQVDVAAALGVPAASLRAVTANLTLAGSRGAGYVVAYGGGTVPTTSSVNMLPGADVANRAVVPVTNGKITLTSVGADTHLVVDLVGWYGTPGAAGGTLFTPVQPTRLLDTRSAQAPFGALGAGQTRALKVTGTVVPADAKGIVGTLTATGQTATATYASIWPGSAPRPPTSDLNSGSGRTQANAIAVKTGPGPAAGGWVQLYNNQGTSHLILDVLGFFR